MLRRRLEVGLRDTTLLLPGSKSVDSPIEVDDLEFVVALFFFFFFINLFTFGCFCSLLLRVAFSSCGEWGLLSIAVRRLLIVVASLVAEHML